MKRTATQSVFSILRKCIVPTFTLLAMIGLYSFSVKKFGDDFLKQLGISKTDADDKISYGLFDGSIDTYGIKNIKNILSGSRSAITKDILNYTKKYAQSAEFKKRYETIRQAAKPEPETPQSPEDMKRESIAAMKKSIAETEANMKKTDESMKPILEKVLAAARKQLADIENPANKHFVSYQKNYPQLVKDFEARNNQLLKAWETKYPADPLQYIKPRLQEFVTITEDVDYEAALTTKNGMKYFVKPEYERKDDRWKMAFRAGKEVVQPAREFVQQWLKEL